MTSKTKTSFYRRLYVAHLIQAGINTVPLIEQHSGMPRRTAQDTIAALGEIDIQCRFTGANKNGAYIIEDWGAIRPEWVAKNLPGIAGTLGYPADDHGVSS
ncbi:MAG: helix-turn-helix domain-containing protein [Xanthomonadales bacterium]|nr:helix-turn-helix domain-containing protein [Xanthomonadales bacterium]